MTCFDFSIPGLHHIADKNTNECILYCGDREYIEISTFIWSPDFYIDQQAVNGGYQTDKQMCLFL